MEPRNRNVIVVVVALAVLFCLCLAVAAALVLGSVFMSSVRTSGPAVSTGAEDNRTFAVEQGASLRVDNFAGGVTVRAGDEGHILIVAVRHGASSASRERIQIQYTETAEGLEIRTVRPTAVLNAFVEFDIQVPPGTPLEVDTGSGNLWVHGITAGVQAETGSGSITATGVSGDVELQTGAGTVDLQDAVGDIDIRTGSGSLTLRGIEGDIEAQSGTGRILVEGANGQVRVETGSGGIEYRGTPVGECRFETGSGSIVLYLRADVDARVDLESSSGSVDVQFPVDGESSRDHVEGVIGSGEEASIQAHTGSGSIDVRQY